MGIMFKSHIKQAKDGIFAANAIASLALIIALLALAIAIGNSDDNG